MKKSLLVLVASLMLVPCNAIAEDDFNGVKAGDAVIFNGGQSHKLIECEPEGWYYYETQVLTIEFPVAGFETYTLSVSSMYNTLDFYVTTPFVSVPIYDTNVTIELQLETASGDMYYGSFEASSNTSTE